MDRMPKEFKTTVYFIVIELVFYGLFILRLFEKLRYPSLLYIGIPIFFVLLLFLSLFMLKKSISRKLLFIFNMVKSVIFITLIFGLVFFKQAVELMMKIGNIGKFDAYILMAIIFKSQLYGAIALSILIFWSLFIIFLITRKEIGIFFSATDYPLVNTQKYTISLLGIYVVSLLVVFYVMIL
jgi:hypothetical protein